MTNVSDTTIVVIVVAVVLLVALFVVRRGLARLKVGSIKASAPGPVVEGDVFRGSKTIATGDNASVKVDGRHKEINARIGKDDDP